MDVSTWVLPAIFWTCTACIVYSYAAYPLLLWSFARCWGRFREPPHENGHWPKLSLVIAAHNEEAVIEGRLRNALTLDYPRDRFEVIAACDGCSDATPRIAARFSDQGVRVLNFSERRGKTATLNAAIEQSRGDILMLSDANTYTDAAAARKLVRWFADPAVGVVCGQLILTDPATGRNVDSLYWRYENFLKECENRLGALLGANGALYAIRRSLFQPIPANTIVDDFVIPLLARLRSGCAIVYERTAIAREDTAVSVAGEYQRRVRIGAGGFQSLIWLAPLLAPTQGWLAFAFFSHKILRWLGPFFLIGALLSNALLVHQEGYAWLLAGQSALYGLALIGAFVSGRSRTAKLLRLAWMFLSMNLALLAGFGRWLRGSQKAAWQRTGRSNPVIDVDLAKSAVHQTPLPALRDLDPLVNSDS